ncbi:MAG: GNAT family N-acetyltransferase [candidate division WOR-3 bacterium]
MARAQGLRIYRRIASAIAPRVNIAEATSADMQVVQEYLAPGYPHPPYAPNPAVTDYVARAKGKVVGFTQLIRHPPEHYPYVGYWSFSTVTWPRYRGMGIAEQLLREVITRAAHEGASELLAQVLENNLASLGLYHKLGFEVIEYPPLEETLRDQAARTGVRTLVLRRRLP